MTEASVSFAGNLTDDPEVRYTEGGITRAMFRMAVSGRREQEASFFTVIAWRDQAEHAAESLAKGSRVVVIGRLQQRSWTAETAAPAPSWRSWLTSWGRACGGRRRPQPSQPDQRPTRVGPPFRGGARERRRCGGSGCTLCA
jgi:single-stranded DNA-binding protein